MADSIALQILKAIEARLQVASVTIDGQTFTPPAGLTVDRERIGPVMPKHVANGPIIIPHMGGQEPTERDSYKSPLLKRTLMVLVTIAADANDVPNSDAVDPATNWLVQSLQSEPTLGGIAHWINEEGQEDFYSSFEDSASIVAIREMTLMVRFHTRTDNPEVRS